MISSRSHTFHFNYRKLFSLGFGLLIAVVITMPVTPHSYALSGGDFQAGDIIDNGVFFNPSTMSSIDVQNFLNAKVPVCDTNGTQIYSGTQTRAQYGASQGYPAPYTCLKDYRQDTPDMPSDSYCTAFSAGNRSAAQIIHDAAAACGINPQILLVLLQKEQSLVTDTWPFPNQYSSATGFGCPDTAPCNTNYAGFFYQVYYAARTFKRYTLNANSYGYFANSNNNILYSPASGCGSSTVYVQNQATADLYIYTPYQPNGAALSNLYGTGDSCSSYGNRNFWRLFNDWFGSTLAAPFAWAPVSQQAYSDSAHTLPVNTALLSPNATYYFVLKAQNMGNSTWHNSGGSANNQVDLGSNNPQNRSSQYANASWLAPNRPATLDESSLAPGAVGTFEFSITTPSTYTSSNEFFNLVAEGQTWMNDVGLYWPVNVKPPTPAWQLLEQGAYYDSGLTQSANISALSTNTTYYMHVKVLNTGNTTWTNNGANPVRLATSATNDHISSFCDSSWITCNRPATMQESSVAPGQTATFNFSMKSPSVYSSYKEYFNLVVEGQAWMNDLGMYWPLNVRAPVALWQYAGQAAYTDSSMSATFDTSSVANLSRFYMTVQARNIGNTTWTNNGANPVDLGMSNPNDHASSLCDSTWLGCNRPGRLQQSSVTPGQTGTFGFWMNTPYAANGMTYKEYFTPVVEGQAWMNDLGLNQSVTMNTPVTSWQYVDPGAYTNSARTTSADLSNATVSTTYYLQLKLKNTGGSVWRNNGSSPLNLGTTNPQNRSSIFCNSSWLTCSRPATLQESSVSPGQVGTFNFSISTSSSPVTNQKEYFQPVLEGQAWLTDIGLYWQISTH